MLTCTIKDPDLDQVHTDYNGIKFRAFCNRESELPQVKAVGDVILLRNIKVSSFHLYVAESIDFYPCTTASEHLEKHGIYEASSAAL